MVLEIGDVVQMRKAHPCGSVKWTITRVGADIKIRCLGCGHVVMMGRPDFEKRLKRVLTRAGQTEGETETVGKEI